MNHYLEAFRKEIPEEIISSWKINSNQNIVYGIETNKQKYILKQFSKDAIKSLDELEIKREQIRISSLWTDSQIPCILPLTDIYSFEGYYYIIYPYFEGETISEEELSIEEIRILAKNQAKMHLLSISSFLGNHIKKVEIKDPSLSFFQDKMDLLVEASLKNSCMCQNDYKPLNILWKNHQPYMVDFDAVGYNHPTFSLFEALFTYSYRNQKLDTTYFEEYLKAYLVEYKLPMKDVELAFFGAWNGKLQWLNYLLDHNKEDFDILKLSFQMKDSYQQLDSLLEIVKKYQ